MRIAQIVLAGASQYEQKSQRADHAVLSPSHELLVTSIEGAVAGGAQAAFVYATGELPAAPFRGFPIPYLASADLRPTRWPFRRPAEPDFVVSPVLEKVEQSRFQPLPEAVEDSYFEARWSEHQDHGRRRVIGSYARPSVRNMVEQTLARLHRFREDVTWELWDRIPSPQDLAGVDVWADPATGDDDLDGFVAEALVVGAPVVAARTRINLGRMEGGRTGFLVPPRDPNEMTHAILAALFKREAAEPKQLAARQTASKFRARQRGRILVHMFETLIP